MHQFETTTGVGDQEVTVDYSVNEFGYIEIESVWISTTNEPFEIIDYLGDFQIAKITTEAQKDYLNKAVDKVEKEILG